MDEERKIIFANYVSHISQSGKTTACIGKHVRYIKDFLDSGYELTRKGFETYKKNNAGIHCEYSAKEAILDLLHFSVSGIEGRNGRRMSFRSKNSQ